MARKRKSRRGHTDIIDSDPEDGSSVVSAPPPTDSFLRETARMGIDGSVRQEVRMVPVPASPGRSSAVRHLLPDEFRPPESLPPTAQRCFDLYEDEGVLGDQVDEDDEEPRELRDSDYPLREWMKESRDVFLQELLLAEGRGDHREYDICPACSHEKAEYRCKTCVAGGELVCKACVIKNHQQNPLHAVERWTSIFFEKTTLKDVGLRIQLGHWHQRDRRCAVPTPAPGDDFVIIDDHGVHRVALDFCGCGGGSHTKQLLRAQLYPATVQAPRSAATFAVLRRFHLLSFESKCSAYEFYHSLARETNNSGLLLGKDRYHEFLRMTREWRNLQMLKRTGRGHAASGIAGTQPGECALLCPACPQPGKNLPPNWKDVPEDRKFLYALFLAMDANFRLKRKDVSSEEADPGLGPGWAFFAEVQAYKKHLADNWDMPQERSTCVAHDAVDKPDREARGTAASGIGAVDCARHNMKRPNAVGDLQLGEKYINMDYMFFLSIAGTELARFYVSYDIACQWHKNIWARMEAYSPEIKFVGEGKFMMFLVPKFHLPAHIEACNLQFSFNLTRDVGQTDGEAPERGWANANPLASSTKEMGPGARRDTLDDHFNDWNHKKIVALGRVMLKKVEDGVPAMVEMKGALKHMEASLTAEALGEETGPVAEWTAMAERWEEDPSQPNPFETLRKDGHLAKVRHELAIEAAAREVAGKELEGAVRDEMHVTELIAMGLQLEEQQRVLRFDATATGLHPTAEQSRAMVERTSKLRRKIKAWIEIQRGFFPVVDRLHAVEDNVRARIAKTAPIPGVQVYDIVLWLPSEIMKPESATALEQTPILKDAELHEYRMRVGQANEALHEIRQQLLVRSHLYIDKDEHARGVRENMRSSSKIEVCDDRIRRMVAQYRAARRALVVLGKVLGRNEWGRALKPLAEDDVRGMPYARFGDPERQKGKGKKKSKRPRKKPRTVKAPKPLSWIWIAQAGEPDPGSSQAMNEAVRIEWARARARAMRWTEEVDLLEEEMRRILQFLTWRSMWWEAQVDLRGLPEGPQREGETAYALRQAKLQADLGIGFAKRWADADLEELIRKGREDEGGENAEAPAAPTAAAGAALDEEGSDSSDDEEEEVEAEENDEGALPVPSSALNAVNPSFVSD